MQHFLGCQCKIFVGDGRWQPAIPAGKVAPNQLHDAGASPMDAGNQIQQQIALRIEDACDPGKSVRPSVLQVVLQTLGQRDQSPCLDTGLLEC